MFYWQVSRNVMGEQKKKKKTETRRKKGFLDAWELLISPHYDE